MSFLSSSRALFHTSHRKTASSSSFVGVNVKVAVVAWSLAPPFFKDASKGYNEPEKKIGYKFSVKVPTAFVAARSKHVGMYYYMIIKGYLSVF